MTLPQRLAGERIALRAFAPGDVSELTALRVRNRDFLGPWEPRRSDGFFTEAGQRAEIERDRHEWAADRTYAFAIVERDGGAMRGRIALANVVRGAWENATLGYFVDEAVGGKLSARRRISKQRLKVIEARLTAMKRIINKFGMRLPTRHMALLLSLQGFVVSHVQVFKDYRTLKIQ